MGLVDLLLEGLVEYMVIKGLVGFSAVDDGDLVLNAVLDGNLEADWSGSFTVFTSNFFFRFDSTRCSAIRLVLNFVAVGLVEVLGKLLNGLVDCLAVLDGDLVDVGLEACSS